MIMSGITRPIDFHLGERHYAVNSRDISYHFVGQSPQIPLNLSVSIRLVYLKEGKEILRATNATTS